MLEIVKYFPATEYPVKIMGDGPVNDKGVVTATILRISPTPFGSPNKKDLHGQYFTEATYFGDDVVQKKFGLYEHFMNSVNNPEMGKRPKKDNILGPATLVKVEGDPTRWFDIEVQRSLEYHDFLMRLADMKLLGASTQAFMNSVEVEADGFIPVWVENEVGPTVSPANPESLKQIASLKMTKPFISLPPMFVKQWKGSELVDVAVDEVQPEQDAEPEATPEVSLSEEIANILEIDTPAPAETPQEPASASVEEQLKAVTSELAAMKASMSVFIELWGADPDEAREAVAQMMGLAKKIDGVEELAKKLGAGQTETHKALMGLAHFIKTFKKSEAGQEFLQMTQLEREILRDHEDKQKPRKIAGTVAPLGAPGTN